MEFHIETEKKKKNLTELKLNEAVSKNWINFHQVFWLKTNCKMWTKNWTQNSAKYSRSGRIIQTLGMSKLSYLISNVNNTIEWDLPPIFMLDGRL